MTVRVIEITAFNVRWTKGSRRRIGVATTGMIANVADGTKEPIKMKSASAI